MKGGAQEKTGKQTKKALIVTTVSGFVPQFEMNNVRILQELGYEVHYASNFRNPSYGNDNSRLDGTGIICHQTDFARSPFCLRENGRAYRQLRRLLKEQHFDLLHCHTPVGAALARLAAEAYRRQRGHERCRAGSTDESGRQMKYKKYKSRHADRRAIGRQGKHRQCSTKMKVIYTAHGFHFFKGAPLKYWLLFYPAERWLARYTDVLITMNREDYARAKRFCRHKNTKVRYIPGEGVNVAYYSGKNLPEGEREAIRRAVRKAFSVDDGTVLLLSVGELIPRKNHSVVIRALAELARESAAGSSRAEDKRERKGDFRYLICGQGVLKDELQSQIDELGLSGKVFLAGYRRDVRALLYAADVFVFPSRQEGMPMALLEAAAAGLPLILSDIRGNRDVAEAIGRADTECFAGQKELKQRLRKAIEGKREWEQQEGKLAERKTNAKCLPGGERANSWTELGRGLDRRFDIEQVGRRMQNIYRELESCKDIGRETEG